LKQQDEEKLANAFGSRSLSADSEDSSGGLALTGPCRDSREFLT
jgi:hypothetical protein